MFCIISAPSANFEGRVLFTLHLVQQTDLSCMLAMLETLRAENKQMPTCSCAAWAKNPMFSWGVHMAFQQIKRGVRELRACCSKSQLVSVNKFNRRSCYDTPF